MPTSPPERPAVRADRAAPRGTPGAAVGAGSPPRLSRLIGAQSLPVAAPVSGCGLRYFDASGGELLPGAGGLDAPGRARVRRIVLDFAIDPASGGAPAARTVEVTLRVPS